MTPAAEPAAGPAAEGGDSALPSPRVAIRSLVVFLVIAGACVALSVCTPLGEYFHVETIERLASTLGPWGPLALVLLGVVGPLLFLPRWPIAFVGGLLYGIVWGSVLANMASTIGAYLHYVMAGSLLGPVSDRLRGRNRAFARPLPRERAFAVLFLFRAFPLSNFVVTNLLAGALKMHTGSYIVATFLGMIPATIMYAAWGKLLKKPSPEVYVTAIATLVVLVLGGLVAQRPLRRWLRSPASGEAKE